MDSALLLKELESLGSEQTRKINFKHGIAGVCFGTSYKDLGVLKKRLKTDHQLAKELCASGNHEAVILATMIADPVQVDARLAESWVKDCVNHAQADVFAGVAAKSPVARQMADKWVKSENEQIGRAGWHLVAQLAMNDAGVSESISN
jgi:3-methyladenine DNA glycosylase AlkD